MQRFVVLTIVGEKTNNLNADNCFRASGRSCGRPVFGTRGSAVPRFHLYLINTGCRGYSVTWSHARYYEIFVLQNVHWRIIIVMQLPKSRHFQH